MFQKTVLQPPPTETIDLIKSYNEFDIQLYDYARKIFEERLSAHVPSIEVELKKFKFLIWLSTLVKWLTKSRETLSVITRSEGQTTK